MSDTHGKTCEICNELISSLHANPAKWGTWLPSGKEHPNVSYYHAFCLKKRFDELEGCEKNTIRQTGDEKCDGLN